MKLIDLFNAIENNQIENDFLFKIKGCRDEYVVTYIINNGYTIYKMSDKGVGFLGSFYIDRTILNKKIKIIKEK